MTTTVLDRIGLLVTNDIAAGAGPLGLVRNASVVFEGDREPMGGGPGQSRGGDESGERRWSLFEGCQNEGRLVQHSDTA